jgi:D-alanyl-D-alanine carboxypeptidase/D-alanyl-D-alanine-endopeptidase (penicillin-binding protein 4)
MPYGLRCAGRNVGGLGRFLAAGALSGSVAIGHPNIEPLSEPLSGGKGVAEPALIQRDLANDIALAVARAEMGRASVGVHVLDLSTGQVLASIDHSETGTFIPASNMKLLTSGAALQVLGPNFAFKTEIRRDADRLIIVGGGDPGLGDPELLDEMSIAGGVTGFMEAVAVRVREVTSLESVSEVVVDDRIFDRRHTHPQWPVNQLNRYYCAEVSGLNFHLNLLYVRVNRTRDNRLAINIEPDMPWIEMNSEATPAGVGESQNSIWLSRAPGTEAITIGGKVRTGVLGEVTIHDPASNFGRLLAASLADQGISLSGGATSSVRLAEPDEVLPEGEIVLVIQTPIERALQRCNTDSYNLYAEAFMKRLGAASGQAGSWSQGAAMLRMVVTERIGSDYLDDLSISDGSGMSRENGVSPELITRWLASFYADAELGEMYVTSLAPPGDGTLRNRFRRERPDNVLRAKTGFINGVRTMSGYVIDQETGRAVAFSALMNDLVKGEHHTAAKNLQEDIVILIDDWLESERDENARAGVDDQADGRGG